MSGLIRRAVVPHGLSLAFSALLALALVGQALTGLAEYNEQARSAELPTLSQKYPDHAMAIVRLRVAPPVGDTSRDEITHDLRKLFPRLHDLRWTDAVAPEAAPTLLAQQLGFDATVRDYLTRKLTETGDPDKDAVLALAETFLTIGGAA